jgi:hypothetical protein
MFSKKNLSKFGDLTVVKRVAGYPAILSIRYPAGYPAGYPASKIRYPAGYRISKKAGLSGRLSGASVFQRIRYRYTWYRNRTGITSTGT